MSALTSCDLCGQLIDPRDPHVTLIAAGIGATTRRSLRWQPREYHATSERDCVGAVLDAIDMATDVAAVQRGEATR